MTAERDYSAILYCPIVGHSVSVIHASHLVHHSEGFRRAICGVDPFADRGGGSRGWIRWCDQCQRPLQYIPEAVLDQSEAAK